MADRPMISLCPRGRGAPVARARDGFALLLAVALLAIAVLLAASLGTLVCVERSAAVSARRAAESRQNALLALHLALGRLQAAAGPDRRVTGRADLLPGSVGNPDWTGVWDAGEAPAGPLTWLVSGNEADPLAATPGESPVADPAPANESVWLLRSPVADPGRRIKLARQAIRVAGLPGLAGPRPVGHYAWWAGDEGVKAKFNLVNPAAGAAPGTAENRRQFASAQQCGMELLAAGFAAYVGAKGDTAAGAALRGRLGRVLTPGQIPCADPGFGLATVRERFHDFTTSAFGVLADVRQGGLKKDLTRGLAAESAVPAGDIFPGGPSWALLRSFAALRPEWTDGRWQIAPRRHAPPQHGAHPVVLLVQVVWGGDRSEGRFRLLLQPLVVLGNPYATALAPAEYRLVWRQTGLIELQSPPGDAGTPSVAGTPAQLLGEDPQFRIPRAGFLPGEARLFALPDAGGPVAYVPGAGLALAEGPAAGTAFRDLDAAADPGATEMRVRVAAGPAGFEFLLAGGGPLQAISGCAAGAPACAGLPPVLGAPVRAGLRMGDDSGNAPGDDSGLRWLADFNVRATEIGPLPAWGRNPLYGPANPRGGGAGDVLGAADSFWGPAARAGDGGQRFVILYHLPGDELHSLGQLQHANLQPAGAGPGYTVGQGYADPHIADGTADFNHRLNEALWDGYFFSTLPAGAGPPPAVLPNGRMVWYRRGGLTPDPEAARDCDRAAAHLLVDGAFNVNSTSVAAWRAQFASLNGQRFAWDDPATGATNVATVGSAFPRGVRAGGGPEDGWRGFRALTPTQVGALAAAVVERVRAHGPFRSLAEFLNRPLDASGERERLCGLLQQALDAVANPPPSLAPAAGLPAEAGPSPGLAWPAASAGHRATLAPGWLSQADVLGQLGPVLTVRSDTFLIRAYGDVVDPATGALGGRAWCEAVVQRLPDYVDPSDPPERRDGLGAANGRFGRRFVVVHFRWLTPDEL